MTVYYFDTSAIIKYYHIEPGSTWVRQVVDARVPNVPHRSNVINLAEITIAEGAAAFAALQRTGHIHDRLRRVFYDQFRVDVLNEYQIVPITRAHIEIAAELAQSYPLRGYDAVQLAAALQISDVLGRQVAPLVFVSGDDALVQAAQAEGLLIDNPYAHIALDP